MDTETQAALAAELTQIAYAVVGEFDLSAPGLTAGSVAAALRTAQGHTYTGICLDLSCGIGFCAEHSAVAEMLKARETRIAMVVAVGDKAILSPCGRCREMMAQVDQGNLATLVVMPGGRITTLRELLPEHWMWDRPIG
jgi:cytidine deaminase